MNNNSKENDNNIFNQYLDNEISYSSKEDLFQSKNISTRELMILKSILNLAMII